MKHNIPKNPISIRIGETQMTVYRVGSSPKIDEQNDSDLGTLLGIHTHFTYEVFFVVAGMLRLVTEIFSRDYKDTVLIIPPKLKHCSSPSGGESYCLLFSFENDSDDANAIKRLTQDGACELELTENVKFYIKRLTEKNEEYTKESEEFSVHIASLLFGEILQFVRSKSKKEKKENARVIHHISTIETYINDNISRKITLSDLSNAVYLSTKQVSRIIKKEYGCSFSSLIVEKRLAKAQMLLKETNEKISEIAAKTFYGTEAYFYKCFKSRYGMSPLQYRKTYIK